MSPQIEFGKATDTGYKDGRVIERVRNPYLQRYKVERALAAIQSSHQRAAFVMNAELGHSLQTQVMSGTITLLQKLPFVHLAFAIDESKSKSFS